MMSSQDTITVRELIIKLFRMWKPVISICILSAIGAYLYKYLKDSSTYRAEVNLIISPENKNVPTRYGIYTLESVNIEDYSNIIYHEDVIDKTIEQFKLQNTSVNKFQNNLSHSLSNYSGRKSVLVKLTSSLSNSDEILDAHIANTLNHLNTMYEPLMISFFENKLKEDRYRVLHSTQDLETRILITDSMLGNMEKLNIADYAMLKNKNVIIDLNVVRNQNHIDLQNELLHNKLEFYENRSVLKEIDMFLKEIDDLKKGNTALYNTEDAYFFNPFSRFIKKIKPAVLQANYRYAGLSSIGFAVYVSGGVFLFLIFVLSMYFMMKIEN